MLDLQSERWAELQHAYGNASDVPGLLLALRDVRISGGNEGPWFKLWSALAHQGDVYPASFAAVPHVIAALASNPAEAVADFFQFPAWVEICRARQNLAVPEDLNAAYLAALARLPALVVLAEERRWDAEFTACALAAVAASKGQHDIAEVALELAIPEQAAEVLDWLTHR